MVYVTDAIMGSGKSSAAINYMNEHPDNKYVYITPFLGEADRIISSCKSVGFCKPIRTAEYEGSKVLYTKQLIEEGKSIATTHQAFRSYTSDMLDMIKEKEYTLIIDEDVEMLEEIDCSKEDIDILISTGYIEESNGELRRTNKRYSGNVNKDILNTIGDRNAIMINTYDNVTLFFWHIPPDLITSFKDVYILTYLFDAQDLKYMLEIYSIPYAMMYTNYHDGRYLFSSKRVWMPEYISTIKDKIHILEDDKLNAVGKGNFDLSVHWFSTHKEGVSQLHNHLVNYFQCRAPNGISASDKMWSTFKCAHQKLKGKGYTKGYVPFNSKATNEYKDKKMLAYCVNIFMPIGRKLFLINNNVEPDEDSFALSNMVQWVWRSAIREGKEIWIYIPSSRMRRILYKWLDELEAAHI